MTNANVFQLCQPGTFADPLTEILRNGARAPDPGGARRLPESRDRQMVADHQGGWHQGGLTRVTIQYSVTLVPRMPARQSNSRAICCTAYVG